MVESCFFFFLIQDKQIFIKLLRRYYFQLLC